MNILFSVANDFYLIIHPYVIKSFHAWFAYLWITLTIFILYQKKLKIIEGFVWGKNKICYVIVIQSLSECFINLMIQFML